MSEAQKFLNKASFFMVIDNVSKVLEPVLKLSCAKYFVGGSWGSFVFLESLVLMLIRFCLLGLDKGAIWSHGQLQDNHAYIRRFSRSFGFVALLTSVIAFIAFFVPMDLLPNHQSNSSVVASSLEQAIMLMAIPFQALTILLLQALICRENLSANILVKNLILPLVTFGGPLLAYVFIPNFHGLPYCYFGAQVVGFTYAAIVFSKTYWPELKSWVFIPFPEWVELKFSLPLSLSDFLNSVVLRVDNILLMSYVGVHGVEIYSIAIMISKITWSIRESFDNVTMLIFSKKETQILSESKKQTFNYVCWLVISVQIPILALMYLYGRDLILLWEPKYIDSYMVILATSSLLVFSIPGTIAYSLLIGLGKTVWVPVVQSLFFGGIIGLNFLLIPTYGALGAGVAFALSMVIANTIAYIITANYTKSMLFTQNTVARLFGNFLIFTPLVIFSAVYKDSNMMTFGLLLLTMIFFGWNMSRQMKVYKELNEVK
jgi:O-antigen/teichoic acid export membrane protein